MEETIIILPSDASSAQYPDNKIGNYKVDLDPPLDLSRGKWEVALLDIDYPTRWNNVVGKNDMTIEYNHPTLKHKCTLRIPPGLYRNARSFFNAIYRELQLFKRKNKACKGHIKRLKLTKHGGFNMDTYTHTSIRKKIAFSPSLARALGVVNVTDNGLVLQDNWFPPQIKAELDAARENKAKQTVRLKYDNWYNAPDESGQGVETQVNIRRWITKFVFPNQIHPNINFRQVTVHTNIISPDTHVDRGNKNGGILRTFVPEVITETGSMTHREFVTPHYKKILDGFTTLRTIDIKLLDELGRPIQFTTGKVSVTLSIKQVG